MKKTKQRLLFLGIVIVILGVLTGCGKDSAKEYISWTAKDWENASVEEKKEVAKAYTEHIGNLTGIDNVKEQIENFGDDDLNALVGMLDSMFQTSEGKSLKEMVEAAVGESPKEVPEEAKE